MELKTAEAEVGGQITGVCFIRKALKSHRGWGCHLMCWTDKTGAGQELKQGVESGGPATPGGSGGGEKWVNVASIWRQKQQG